MFLDERFTVAPRHRPGPGVRRRRADRVLDLPTGGNSDLIGVLLCLVSAVAYSISLILQKPLVGRLPAVHVTWLACTVGAISCLPFAGDLVRQAARRARVVDAGGWSTSASSRRRSRSRTYAFALKHMSASSLGVTTYLVPADHDRDGRGLPRRGAAHDGVRRRRARPGRRRRRPAQAASRATCAAQRTRRLPRCTPDLPGQDSRESSPSGPRKASRLRVGSPRETRQSHSLRIEEAKPSSRIVLNEPSAYSSTAPSSRSISSVVDRGERQPRVEVDVAHPVERERDGVHLHVALQQPPVDALEVLVGLAAHERVHLQRVPADVETAGRLQLLLARAARPSARWARPRCTPGRLRRTPRAGRPAPARARGSALVGQVSHGRCRTDSVAGRPRERSRSGRRASSPAPRRRPEHRVSRPVPAELLGVRLGARREPLVQPGLEQTRLERRGVRRRLVVGRPAGRTRPSRTAVVSPPTAAATTGVPVACASMATSPKLSLYDGTQTSVDAAYQSTSSSCATGGTNRTEGRCRAPRPGAPASRAARARSRTGRRPPRRSATSAARGAARAARRPRAASRRGPSAAGSGRRR